MNILNGLEESMLREIEEAAVSLNPSAGRSGGVGQGVTVTAKSTSGMNPTTPLPPPSSPAPTKGQEFATNKLAKMKRKGKKPALEFSVLGGPDQMKETLLRLLKDKNTFQPDIGVQAGFIFAHS